MMNHEFSVGDIVKSYDFRGNNECYVIGTVSGMNTEYIMLNVFLEVWQNKVLDVKSRVVQTVKCVMNGWTDRLVKLA